MCKHCPKMTMTNIVHGATGIAKSVAGVDRASDQTIHLRTITCYGCQHALPCKHKPRQKCRCSQCGCWLLHKIRLKSESCPVGKWGQEPPDAE